MSAVKKFTDLEVWQLSNELEKKVFHYNTNNLFI